MVLEHVEAQVEVLPIKVYSEKDLVNELSAIQAALENPNPDEWQSRMEALQRLQQLAVGGAAVFEQFVQALKGMQDAIAAQISDPRSLLSREACATVSILAQVHQRSISIPTSRLAKKIDILKGVLIAAVIKIFDSYSIVRF